MKHVLLKSMLLLCALTLGVTNLWAESIKWIKTAPADLKANDVVVIVDVTKAVAIANNPASDKTPSATAVTLDDDKGQITGDVDATLEWTLEAATGNKCYFKTGDNYLFVKGSQSKDDGLRVGVPADGDVKAFGLTKDEAHDNADFLAVVMSDTENRYVGVKDQYISKSWKTPNAINDDIKDTRIAFFKKVVSNKANAGISWNGTTDGNAQADLHPTSGTNTFPSLANPNSLTGITYSSSNTWVADIDANTGAITLKKRGTVTITASRAEDATYDAATASYTLRIDDSSSEEGTLAHPFASPSVAINYVKGNNATDGWTYFVTGRVSKIGAASASQYVPGLSGNNSTEGTLTYYISDDGTTGDATKELQISSGRYMGLKPLDDHILSVGDIVTVCGPLVYASATNGVGGGIGGGGTGTGSGSGSGEKTVKMEATNYIHAHTPVLSTNDMTINNGVVKGIDSFYTLDNTNVNGTKGAVTVESSKTDIVSWNSEGMTLTANKIGESVITIKIPVTLADSKSYTMASKFTLTVQSRDVAPESSGTYQLVTDANQLQDGDRLLIVGNYNDGATDKPYAMSTKQNDANRGAVTVTISENQISEVPTDAQVVTLEIDTDGKYFFNVGSDSYLYASSSDADELKMDTKANAGDKAKATIAIDGTSNEATIAFGGGMTHNTIRFDCFGIMSYIISSDFACYTSDYTVDGDENTATLPKIYRFVADPSYTIKTSANGYKTLVSSVDVASLPEGLTAYIVTSIAGGNAQLTAVTDIKAGEPYILKGSAGATYTLTTGTATAPEGNLLAVSDATTNNGVYVFATPSGKPTGFYKWNGGRLGSGRVYLPADAISGAPSFIGIDENTTGIQNLTPALSEGDGAVYNLNGQRVAQPTKGLYIVNGKKVIVK